MGIKTRIVTLFLLNVAWKVHFWHHFCILASLNNKIQDLCYVPYQFLLLLCFSVLSIAMCVIPHSLLNLTWESHFKKYPFISYDDFMNISIMTVKKIVKINIFKWLIDNKVESLWTSQQMNHSGSDMHWRRFPSYWLFVKRVTDHQWIYSSPRAVM